MVSDEERRTVARRIRQLDQRGKNNLFSTCLNCGKWLGAVYGDENYCAEEQRQFRLCLGLKNSLAARIADLIDRPTCRNVYDESKAGACENGFECSECGNVVEDGEGWLVNGTFNYCSECGAEVVE